MNVIISDTGFAPDSWKGGFAPLGADNSTAVTPEAGLDLASSDSVESIKEQLDKLEMIRVDFPTFADGRGFTLAAMLRRMGYTGRLRARGHILADQYAMARRAGFDEVEISGDLAARQGEAQWLRRANWRDHNYQARLRG